MIQKYVTAGRDHTGLRRNPERDAFVCCVTVDEKQPAPLVDLLHQPRHVPRVPGQQAAAMTAHTDGEWHRLKGFREGKSECLAAHVERDAAWFNWPLLLNGLQRQVQQHFLTTIMGEACKSLPMRCLRQHGERNRTWKLNRTSAGLELVAEVVDNNCDAWPSLGETLRREQRERRRQQEAAAGH
jgi:hypothetical protein